MAFTDRQLLDSLSRMPFVDSAELAGILGEAHTTLHRVLAGLLAEAHRTLVQSLPQFLIQVVQLLLQPGYVSLDARTEGSGGSAQAVFLRHQHGHHLVSAGDQRIEGLGLGVPQGAHGRTNDLGEVSQDLSIQSVGLGQRPGGPGKVSHLAGIDHHNRQRRRCQGSHQGQFQATRGFQQHHGGTQVPHLGDQLPDACIVIGDLPSVAGGTDGNIHHLLDVARIETGTLPVTPEPAEVAVLVDQARSAFSSAGGRNNLAIDIPPDLPLVMADRRRIVQVVGNLLSNAAKHSSESAVIRISAVREGVHVAVSVADEGRGIPSERLPYLFRKFTRTDGDDLGSGVAGSGLGLAICNGIVEAHGGRIWAESERPGMGARFTFTIPTVEEAGSGTAIGLPPLSTPAARRAVAGPGERVRVLAVDDDPQALRYVRDALASAGYTPVVTGDPAEALRLVGEEKPDLVLLDLMLPGTDGIELMKDILGAGDAPVIFVSAYGRDELIARAFDMGAVDYVVKPFSPTELAARIRAALRKRAASEPSEPYVLGDLTIDYAERSVTLAGRPLPLIAMEYRLLAELSANAGRLLTYEHLLERVWGGKSSGDVRPMRTIVSKLRRKLGDDADNPIYIFTEPRVGYRMPKGGRRNP